LSRLTSLEKKAILGLSNIRFLMDLLQFFVGIIFGLFQVLLYGGIVIIGVKAYEWYDDKFLEKKKTGYFSKQKFGTVRFIVPPETYIPISEMEAFFVDATSISGGRSISEIYAEGKWFFNLVFEIVAKGGEINTYLTAESGRLELALTFLKTHYPGIESVRCDHPFKNWPENWWDEDGVEGLKGYRGADVVLGKNDVHPIKSWKHFYRDGVLISDPMALLINFLKTTPPDAYVVLQYIFRPFDARNRIPGWKKEVQRLRNEFTSNGDFETDSRGFQRLTKEEESILSTAQASINKPRYRLKFRWVTIYDKNNKNIDEGNIKKGIFAYLNEYTTNTQKFTQSGPTNTDESYGGGHFGPLDGKAGKWLNRIYYKSSEKLYRMKRFYKGLIGKEIDFGTDSNELFLDCESCASLFHFPEIKIQTAISSIYGNYKQAQPTPNSESPVVIQQYQPAFYLQNDGSQTNVENPSSPQEYESQYNQDHSRASQQNQFPRNSNYTPPQYQSANQNQSFNPNPNQNYPNSQQPPQSQPHFAPQQYPQGFPQTYKNPNPSQSAVNHEPPSDLPT